MMRTLTVAAFGLSLMACGYTSDSGSAMSGGKMSHAHMGHVTTGWKDTPGGKGLLTTAIEEAKIAVQHAGFAAQKPNDLGWMQTHTRHVLHAVDPSTEPEGPGMGYGVIRGAGGSVQHINFAAGSDDASDNVKAHAVHVAASSENTVIRAKEIVALGGKVLKASSAGEASPVVMKIQMLARQLLDGADANGDGQISWEPGEGGLNEAMKHMGFMFKGEGMMSKGEGTY